MSSVMRYVVRQQEYAEPTAAGVRRVLPEKWTTVATFPHPADAHTACSNLTGDAHRALNPFLLGGPNLFFQTSLPAYALHDFLLDHGVNPPANTARPDYADWWEQNTRWLTNDQRAVVWRACDKLKLFEVVEEDDNRAVWRVMEIPWRRSDGEGWTPSHEGGLPVSVWPTVREAKRAAEALTHRRRAEWDPAAEFELHRRAGYAHADLWPTREQVPFAEVVRVPLADERLTAAVHLVCRQSFSRPEGEYELEPWDRRFNWGARVPLVASGTPDGAARDVAERIRRAKRTVNPFALLVDHEYRGRFAALLADAEPDHCRRSAHWPVFVTIDRQLPNGLTIPEAVQVLRQVDSSPPPPDFETLFDRHAWIERQGEVASWYDLVVRWSPEFIDVVWATFADFCLFEVVEVSVGSERGRAAGVGTGSPPRTHD